MNPALADAEARERIATDLATSLFVEAAAGTGKTSVLVARVVSVLRRGLGRLPGMVLVTFTEKAAGEMKLRLRTEIEAGRKADLEPVERARLEAALKDLELSRIGTIHSLCSDLLREHPVEAGVDPLFEVLVEDASDLVLADVFDRWFESVVADPPEGVRRALRRPVRYGGGGPREDLLAAVKKLIAHRELDTDWELPAFDRAASLERVLARLEDLAAIARPADRPDDWLSKGMISIATFIDENRLR
ncbi:MAG: UvrD-helicase domain-containing protein, partial [Planctomycetota bacterium]